MKKLLILALAIPTLSFASADKVLGTYTLVKSTHKSCPETVALVKNQKKCLMISLNKTTVSAVCNLNKSPKISTKTVKDAHGRSTLEVTTTAATDVLGRVAIVKDVKKTNAFGVTVKSVTTKSTFDKKEKALVYDTRKTILEPLRMPMVKARRCVYKAL